MPDQYFQGTPGAAAQRLRPPSRRAERLPGAPTFVNTCDDSAAASTVARRRLRRPSAREWTAVRKAG